MTGSIDEAEDLVQERYATAWRSRATNVGRAGLRTWLYRIATRVCLKALERAERRPLPSGLGVANADGDPDQTHEEIAWLQPYPDDPAEVAARYDHVRLALIAAMQYLSPLQRAVLILREVLAWSAREVADALGTTTVAVNSALQRARARLGDVRTGDGLLEPTDAHARELLAGYVRAFERADATSLTELLTKDATWEMPPIPTWFAGRAEVVAFLTTRLTTPGAIRLVPIRANGQPAFALYAGGVPHAIHVLTVTKDGIAAVVAFHDPGLFEAFGLSGQA